MWAEVVARPSRLLVLDFDGTLAPLEADRSRVRMPDCVRAALEQLLASGRSHVAIVSGRPLDELRELTDGLDVHRVAEHGWDELPAGGVPLRHPLPARAVWALSLADDEATGRGWVPRIERKRCSRVLHTRGMPPAEAAALEAEVEEAWRSLASRHALDVRGISGGLELRVPGVDKGTAVAALMDQCPPGTLVACIGDDETDEDAFAQVAPGGWAIRVGAPELPSRANARLESVEQVGEFLLRWGMASAGEPGAADGHAR